MQARNQFWIQYFQGHRYTTIRDQSLLLLVQNSSIIQKKTLFSIVNCARDLTAIVAQWRNSKQEKVCSEILTRLVKWCCTAGKQCKPTDFALQATLPSPIYIYFRAPLKVTPQLFSITADFLCSSSFFNISEVVVIFRRILIKYWIELSRFLWKSAANELVS